MRAFLLLLALAVSTGVARPGNAQVLSLGVRVGATKSHVDPNWDHSSRHGITAGLAARLQFSRIVGVQLEGVYSEKGWEVGPYRLFLNYLEAPILVRLTAPPRLLGMAVSAVVGVSMSTEAHCSFLVGTGGVLQSDPALDQVIATDCINVRNRLNDYSLVVGGEIERPFARGRITIEGRYVHGLQNLSYGGGVLRNRSLAVLFGFAFDILPRRRAAV